MRCVAGKYNEPADEGLHSDASEVSDMSISRFSVRSTQSEQPNRSLRCSVCLPACLPLLCVHYRVAQKSLVHFQHTISSEPFKIKRNGFHRNVPRVSSLQCLERLTLLVGRQEGLRFIKKLTDEMLPSTYPKRCYKQIRVSPKMRVFYSETLSHNSGLSRKFRHHKSIVHRVINSTHRRSSLLTTLTTVAGPWMTVDVIHSPGT